MPKKKPEENRNVCPLCSAPLKLVGKNKIQAYKTKKIRELEYVCGSLPHFGRYVYAK
ncbi:MAG: hypothetical protein QME47_05990 [Candidatus Thermoplasmatota archaeon]|nr:hypothetical protein [Candidatus Thermoplasmatota archaeon]